MQLSDLALFVDAVRRGGFSAVARDRNLSPSSVSRAIASLESELGVRLLQRTTRRLSLTEAGSEYFRRVEPLVDELKRAGVAVSEISEVPRGELRVTASVSFGLQCLVPLLPEFSDAYPEVTIDLILTDAVVDLIGENVDLAIRLGPRQDSSLIGTRLRATRYHVCASPAYIARHGRPDTPKALAQHNCLRFPLPGYRNRWTFRDADNTCAEVAISGRLLASNAIALRDSALAGMGIVLLADWLVGGHLAEGELVDLFPQYTVTATDFDTAAWVLYPSRDYLPRKTRLFVDFLKARLGEYGQWPTNRVRTATNI